MHTVVQGYLSDADMISVLWHKKKLPVCEKGEFWTERTASMIRIRLLGMFFN